MSIFSQVAPGLLLNDALTETQLAGSPMCINGMRLLAHATANDGIPLTRSGFLYRRFVTWAAEEFRWPGYEANKLYQVNKVLNEQDFFPLSVMHELLVAARLIRHVSGKAVVTRMGKHQLGNFGGLEATLFEAYFTAIDFSNYERFPSDPVYVDYGHFLGVIANRLDSWTPFAEFAGWCVPIDALPRSRFSPEADACWLLMSRLVRPLKWLGLLDEEPHPSHQRIEERRLRKSSLFDQLLVFGATRPQGELLH